jgi:hypothetical protein
MDSIVCELKDNIDELVVLHLTCTCLTGLLVGVSDDAAKIVSRSSCQNRGTGRVTVVRLEDIQAVTVCE